MITSEKYIILDEFSDDLDPNTELCIINFNIQPFMANLKNLINLHKTTTFWIATKDFSKNYIQKASKLGIKNIIPIPIKQDLIEKFFNPENSEDNSISKNEFKPLENSNVMIVDDNELNIALLTEILSDLGVNITSLKNPLDCKEQIFHKKYDLFLLDILMPEMSGFELAEIIKNSELNSSSPIIFISAISGEENMLNGYKLGAYSYIEKPYKPDIVKSQIYNILKSEENKTIIDKEKDNFVATLTHDLKSPINAEICTLKYLLKKKPDEIKNIQTEMLAELLNSAKYMKLITDKILTHYKQKNKNLTIKKEKTDINNLIISSIEEVKYLTKEKDIQIRLFSPDERIVIDIDPLEIKRVFNNLLANAIEYSYKNSFIDIKLEKTANCCICAIKDYGIGINLLKYKNIFDEYVSLSKEHKKVGFGLGLNVCKSIITAHKGTIKIDSEPSKGTEITFQLPL